jgi:hypothetical protein
MEINEKYEGLSAFLTLYVDEYFDGKKDDEIFEKSKKENDKDYIRSIQNEISDFISDKGYSCEIKLSFLKSTNLYFKDCKQSVEWLKKINKILS